MIPWKLFLVLGPFLTFSILGWVGEAIDVPWTNILVQSPGLHAIILGLLVLYSYLLYERFIKTCHDWKSENISLELFVIPIFVWCSIATGAIMFEVTTLQTMMDMYPEDTIHGMHQDGSF